VDGAHQWEGGDARWYTRGPSMVESSGVSRSTLGPHRPWLAALLSFILPGLGQAYAGRRRLAVFFVAPVAALVLVGVAAWAGAIC
jgi:hypothetical protein